MKRTRVLSYFPLVGGSFLGSKSGPSPTPNPTPTLPDSKIHPYPSIPVENLVLPTVKS